MQLKNKQMKVVSYRDAGDPPNPRNVVAYKRYNRMIVFTGLHDGMDGGRGSTCNFAEEIVMAIAKNENIDPVYYTFFDLKTRTGYGDSYELGDYNYDELRLQWEELSPRPDSVYWIERRCTSEILRDFAEFIWQDASVGKYRNRASEVYGSLK